MIAGMRDPVTERHVDEDGILHNEAGPAIVYENGAWFWYYHGYQHRLGGPASHSGMYWCYGNRHGYIDPNISVKLVNGVEVWVWEWEVDHTFHRLEIFPDGLSRETATLLKNGALCRETYRKLGWIDRIAGPATVRAWVGPDDEEFLFSPKNTGMASVGAANSDSGYTAELWYREGYLHREDGPAFYVVGPDGETYNERWFVDDYEFDPETEGELG